jgi:hypothetical protein
MIKETRLELITDLHANFVSDLPDVRELWRESVHGLAVP